MGDEAKECYTLLEAAELAARGNTQECGRILHKLKQAVLGDKLKVYQQGSLVACEIEDVIRLAVESLSERARTAPSSYPGGLTRAGIEYDQQLREYLLPDHLEVFWDKLNKWLEENEPRLFKEWRFPKPKAVKVVVHGADSQSGNDWKDKAREIADKCFDLDTSNNCRDSLAGYSKRVMEEMQKCEIHGPRGRIDNPNTIQREALQADQWWKQKKK